MARYLGFVGPSYTSESKIAAYDRTVNWYPERIESGTGVATYVLYPTPGYVTNVTLPDSPGRGIFATNGVLYVIYGTSLYTVSTEVVIRAQGLSNPSGGSTVAEQHDGVAQMLTNGDAGHQLLIRSGITLYAFDFLASDVPEPLDPPAAAPTHGQNAAGGIMPAGYFGYAYTFVIAGNGETTASPRITLQNPGIGDPFGGTELVEGITKPVSVVTSVNVYRTTAQVSEANATTAQLKLVGSITNADVQWSNSSPVLQFTDTFTDASLGVNVPTVNTATVSVVSLTTIPGLRSDMIAYLNGYGLSLDVLRSEVSFSNLLDFSTWDALDVFQRNDAADKWKAMIVHHNEVWLFGSETTSIYYNSDDPDLPFQPIKSAFVQVGIFAPLSACVVGGTLMWIGQGSDGAGVVYAATGYTPERISTHAVELAFNVIRNANVDALTLAEGSTYQENGHVFYVLTFPTSNGVTGATWVYDATAGLWHERGGTFDGLVFPELDTRGYGQINAATYTLSRTSGAFYRQWYTYSTGTDGLGIKRLRRAPHISKENKGTIIDAFEVHLETGIGLGNVPPTDPGYDPQLSMRFSNNGGQTWSNTRTVSAGKIGQFRTRAIWTRLGYGRDRLIELTCSAPIPWRIIDAYVDVRIGAA